MARIAGGLVPGETVVLEARRHWLVPLRASLLPAGLVLAGLVLWAITPSGVGALGVLSTALAGLRWGLLLGGLGWVAGNLVRWRAAVVAVTTRRIVRMDGVPGHRRRSETMLAGVGDVRLQIGFLGARLGYGDASIETAAGGGATGVELLETLAAPRSFRAAVLEAKAAEAAAARSALVASVPAWGGARGAAGAASAAAGAASATGAGWTSGSASGGAPSAPGPAPGAPGAAGARGASSGDEIVTRLVRLAELRDRGIISDADFEAKKAELLARL